MTYEQGIAALRGWEGRPVLFVHLIGEPPPVGHGVKPTAGILVRRDMWPDSDPDTNPQYAGDVEFFEIVRPRMATVIRPPPPTVALHRSVFTEAAWLGEGRGISFLTGGPWRFDFWLDESLS